MDELNKGSFVNELVDTIKKTNEDNSINSMNPEVVIQWLEVLLKKKMKIMLLIVWINQKLLILWLKMLLKKNDEDNPIYNMNKGDIVDSMVWIKREIVDSMVGSVVKKDEGENAINSMNKGEIVDSLVNQEENITGSVIKEWDKLIGDLNNPEFVD